MIICQKIWSLKSNFYIYKYQIYGFRCWVKEINQKINIQWIMIFADIEIENSWNRGRFK